MRKYYFSSKSGVHYHLTYSIDSTEADIIVLGSGRAHAHYVPQILEEKLNMSCFNTGMDGHYLFNNYAVFKAITERYTPKIIILDIRGLHELYIGTGGYEQVSSILPYYQKNQELRSVIELKSKFEKLKLISKIYPFNSALLTLFKGAVGDEDITASKGYRPFFGSLTSAKLTDRQIDHQGLDPNKAKILETIASECKARNIEVIIIQSPIFFFDDQGKAIKYMNELSTKYNIEFWNYANDPFFMNPGFFKDREHMNDIGARAFTKAIADRLRTTMNR